MSKEKLRDNIASFHENDIFIDRRTITIFGEIDLAKFESVFKNLHSLDFTNGPINVIINSEGGDVTQGKAIYDAILGCNNHVNGIVYGQACSSASFILQACDSRIMTPDSKLMLHIGEEGIASNHPRNVDREYAILREDEKWMEDVYLKKIKEKKKRYTRNQLKSLLQWDKYMSPQEALDFGLIDLVKEKL